jgi:hypothetical protein
MPRTATTVKGVPEMPKDTMSDTSTATFSSLVLAECDDLDDEFDLDVRVSPAWYPNSPDIHASGTCGGCPDPSDEGSTCKFSCPPSCGGNCTYNPADSRCDEFAE